MKRGRRWEPTRGCPPHVGDRARCERRSRRGGVDCEVRKLPEADLLKLRGSLGWAMIERLFGKPHWRVVFRWQGVGIAEWCRSRPQEFHFACRADARLFAEAALERGGLGGLQPVLVERAARGQR